jgi:hypothetical protein
LVLIWQLRHHAKRHTPDRQRQPQQQQQQQQEQQQSSNNTKGNNSHQCLILQLAAHADQLLGEQQCHSPLPFCNGVGWHPPPPSSNTRAIVQAVRKQSHGHTPWHDGRLVHRVCTLGVDRHQSMATLMVCCEPPALLCDHC